MIRYEAALGPGLLLTDLLLKHYAEHHVETGTETKICGGRFLLRRVHNKGMCMNLLEEHPDLVRYASVLAAAVLSGYHLAVLVFRKPFFLRDLGLSLMNAGAWSNTLDRCLRHHVVDYIGVETKWKRLRRITFNLGDLFLVSGSICVLAASLLRKKG